MNSRVSPPQYQLPAGYDAVAFERIDSTNEEAKRRAGVTPGPTWFIAECQSAGRGRRGRVWVSEPGNLYASLLLRPGGSAGAAALLAFAAALAVADAVEEVTGVTRKLGCKWPNDVLYGGRKISGILLESSSDKAGALDWLVIGVGINLAHFPPNTDYPATSVAAEGFPGVTTAVLFSALARWLDRWLETWRHAGFAPIREAWLARATGLGKPIVARTGSDEIAGLFRGLGGDGALLIERADGSVNQILAGDIFPAMDDC